MSWIPERVDLVRQPDPLGFARTGGSWPAGTAAKAAELDHAQVPVNASHRHARDALRAAGYTPGRNDILMKALAYRRSST
jgi:hypothetical protein